MPNSLAARRYQYTVHSTSCMGIVVVLSVSSKHVWIFVVLEVFVRCVWLDEDFEKSRVKSLVASVSRASVEA